jgi:hypothetical protein
VTAPQLVALVVGLIAAWFAVWAAILPFAAWFGGWRRLAEEFAAEPGTRGRIVLGSAAMRYGAHYGGVILLDCRPTGLVLSVRKLFRLAHPPLLIPWSQVVAESTKLLWIFPAMRLELGRDAQIPLTFYNREARDLVASYTGGVDQPEAWNRT